MEIKDYFLIIKKRILLILLITFGCTLLSGIISYFVIKPVYKSDVSVIIGNVESKDNTKSNYNDVIMYQKMVKTYMGFVKMRVTLDDVIKELDLDLNSKELSDMITVTPSADTEILTISIKSKNREEAPKIANQIAKSLKKMGIEFKKVDNVQLLDEAIDPAVKDSPKPLLNIAIAFLVGLMFALGLVFLIEYLDNTVKDEDEISNLLGVPVIGIIPIINDKEERK